MIRNYTLYKNVCQENKKSPSLLGKKKTPKEVKSFTGKQTENGSELARLIHPARRRYGSFGLFTRAGYHDNFWKTQFVFGTSFYLYHSFLGR